jgi:hypothetical protein
MLLTRNVSLCYVNEVGLEISLGPFSTFWAERCEETVQNRVFSAKQAGTDGAFATGMSMDARHIVISGFVMNDLGVEAANRSLQTVFNPILRGTLYYSDGLSYEAKKEISCRVEEVPNVYWSQNRLKFDIKLVCLDPFWKGAAVVEAIAETLKRFRFPLSVSRNVHVFGIKAAALKSRFENAGNVEGGFTATLRARYGTVVNPEIRNEDTGERIRLNYTMKRDDVVLIVSDLQEKRVEINGVNGFRHLDAEASRFFRMSVGTNTIGYRADENVSNLFVHVRYVPGWTFA